MANGTVVTRKGLQLITKLVASETALTFTRVAIGTGKVPGGYDPGSMTGLNEYKMDGSIASHSASGDEASVVMQISSIGVETGFTITEAGLFATDPDEGEILYAYLDMSADPQYMYPENNAISKFIEMTLVVKIGEVQSVTAVINPGSLVTKEKFDEIAYPTLPKLDESKNEQDYILDGGEDIRWLLARYEYVKQHYAKSIDLMDEKRTSVHQNDIINGFGEGVTGDLVTVMGTILGQKHDTDINYLKNYGLLKSMITQANVDSLDKIPSAYLLYQLNKDLLDKYEDLLTKYNELNSNFTNVNIDKNKGVIVEDDIGTLSSPSQLIHCGFYRFDYCSADVNSKLDPGKGGFTDYTTGDFHALLMSKNNYSNGCSYGTLIVTSPRFSGKFWIGRIWNYKFIDWYKFSGS